MKKRGGDKQVICTLNQNPNHYLSPSNILLGVYYLHPYLGGNRVKKVLEIMKVFGLFLLLFAFVGAIDASDDSDDTHTVSVTITQTSESEKGNPVTNTYNKEIETTESTNVEVIGEISDNGASVTTNMGEMNTNKDDTITTESDDQFSMPEFKIDESPEKFTAALSKWISSMIDESLIVKMDDFSL